VKNEKIIKLLNTHINQAPLANFHIQKKEDDKSVKQKIFKK
jgi:hypothetical protein